jgi:energy-coupling factor transporter ATP-binding protein EcfA2
MIKPSIDFGYITHIKLDNIRSFERLRINLKKNNSPRMISLIIGRNGTCKSTLLRCIALALCHENDASALLAELGGQLISEKKEDGKIMLGIANMNGEDIGNIEVEIVKKGDREKIRSHDIDFTDDTSQVGSIEREFFVCGYGSDRGIVGKTDRFRGYRVIDSVATLFDYNRSLVNIELMLRRLEDHMGSKSYSGAMKGIKRVLGLGSKHKYFIAKGGGVKVSGPGIGKEIPLDGWADGYRMTLNWLIDLYGWAIQADAVTKCGDIKGILLIDEIDQNLHPAMQKMILNEISHAMPELQIFATTHSPITAMGTESGNIIALHRKGDIVNPAVVPSLVGYSADDILVEESLFGVDPYPGYTREKLDRHRELAAIPKSKRTNKETEEMFKLAGELDPVKLPGLRDDPFVKKLEQIEELLRKGSE